MMAVLSGKQIALAAMKKERTRLLQIAKKAQSEVDEYCNLGSESIAIYDEFAAIINSGAAFDKESIKKIEELKRRENRVKKMMRKDINKLIERQVDAEFAANELQSEIFMIELRLNPHQSQG